MQSRKKPGLDLGALENIWVVERVLFNNDFPSLDHSDGINIYESISYVTAFCRSVIFPFGVP